MPHELSEPFRDASGELQCPICLSSDDLDWQRMLTCGHVGHASCLSRWFRAKRDDCPVCRDSPSANAPAPTAQDEAAMITHALGESHFAYLYLCLTSLTDSGTDVWGWEQPEAEPAADAVAAPAAEAPSTQEVIEIIDDDGDGEAQHTPPPATTRRRRRRPDNRANFACKHPQCPFLLADGDQKRLKRQRGSVPPNCPACFAVGIVSPMEFANAGGL